MNFILNARLPYILYNALAIALPAKSLAQTFFGLIFQYTSLISSQICIVREVKDVID